MTSLGLYGCEEDDGDEGYDLELATKSDQSKFVSTNPPLAGGEAWTSI